MKYKCDYCDNYIDDNVDVCPKCGAYNTHLTKTFKGEPHTIEELKEYADKHNLPLKKMHFYLGEDYKGAKAFGIYRDEENSEFVVYKNKADGSRSIRYRGDDEAYAVNELYQKMREEILNQKEHNPKVKAEGNKKKSTLKEATDDPGTVPGGPRNYEAVRYRAGNTSKEENLKDSDIKLRMWKEEYGRNLLGSLLWLLPYLIVAVVIVVNLAVPIARELKNGGYYNYKGKEYVCYGGNWYEYDVLAAAWIVSSICDDKEFTENKQDYFESRFYDDSYSFENFRDSDIYDEINIFSSEDYAGSGDSSYSYIWDSDWDSDSWDDDSGDWDSGWGWDSDYTDWDSDW